LPDSKVDSKLESGHDEEEGDLDDAKQKRDTVDGGAHKATRESEFYDSMENKKSFPNNGSSDDSDWERQAHAEYSDREYNDFFADENITDDHTTKKASIPPLSCIFGFNVLAD
jgi:hypothetical protein